MHSSPEKIASAREIMLLEGYVITEGAVLSWLLDSGASKHMCNVRTMFSDLVPHCAEVEFGNGVRVRVYYKGTVELETVSGSLELSEVLISTFPCSETVLSIPCM